jgi:mono/diheme cytochrome c family protein
MKKTNLIFGMAILFAIGSTMLSGCSDSTNNEESHETDGEDHHADEDGDDGHEHDGGHQASAGHMDHMNDVRKMLKGELGDKYDEPVAETTSAQLALGEETYKKTCVTCHGDTGKGDGLAAVALEQKPADFTDGAHAVYYSEQGRLFIIRNGIKDTPMVGWKGALNEEEILAVYGYVRSLISNEPVGDHNHEAGIYACPMHPDITSDKAGDKCSKCGMDLVLHEEDEEHSDGDHEH